MIRADFIRHGESTGNLDIPADDHSLIELTPTGWRQADELAAGWAATPSLIAMSPYLRARQTAQPTIKRFPDVAVEVWAIEEFTYLEPSRWNGSAAEARRPHVESYWKAADPAYRDGPGAERFSDLLRRAELALRRLSEMPPDSEVLAFSHGQFIQAIRLTVLFPQWTDQRKMREFPTFNRRSPILNGQVVEAQLGLEGWRMTTSAKIP